MRYLFVLLLLLIGCGGEKGYAPVSGIVTLDGKPLVGASISFQPQGAGQATAGEGSYGKTDAQGAFTLKRVSDDAPGAWVGEHRVNISKTDPVPAGDDAAVPFEHVPAAYRNGSLQFVVPPGGSNSANFELKSS
jgi:hypothetical protein